MKRKFLLGLTLVCASLPAGASANGRDGLPGICSTYSLGHWLFVPACWIGAFDDDKGR